MTHPPRIETTAEAEDARGAAVRALRSLRASTLPAAVIEVLHLACRGLPAIRASLWKTVNDRSDLRLFANADMQRARNIPGARSRIAATDLPGNTLDGAAVRYWQDARDPEFATLAAVLRFGSRVRTALTLPVSLHDAPGLLCVELPGPRDAPDEAAELFLQMVATRIEALFASTQAARVPDAAADPHDTFLDQSHLALSNESLRDLFYLAPTAMILTDLQSARPIAVNRHALALFGIAAQRAEDVEVSDFWDDRADRDQFIREAKTQGFLRGYRARLQRVDGTGFWARMSATVIDHNGEAALVNCITDVSETVAAEDILHRTQKTLATLLEASPYPLIVTRLDNGVIRFCNQKAADMFETPLSGLLGHTAPEFYVNPSDRSYFVEKLRSTGQVEGFVAKLKTESGQPFWAMLSAKTLELNGEPVFMVAFADVTKQKHKQEELENLAFKDGLTNAYNRRYFMEALQIELARSARSERPPSLALLDIDHFKRLNDSHGHEVGDDVLREFVALVQGMLRKTDILARYGGEEFAILFPDTELAVAHDIVERVRATVAAHRFAAHSTATSVTFSAGLAAGNTGSENLSLMASADRALYQAKRAGRNRVMSR